MKASPAKISNLMVLLFAIIFQLSCSKDTDLLADYVIADAQEARLTANLAIDDYFVVSKNEAIVLDVLSNDTYNDPKKVTIVNVTEPSNGTVLINEDKTLTYSPTPSPISENTTNEASPPTGNNNQVPETPEPAETPVETQEPTENEPTTGNEPTETEETPETTSTTFTYTTETVNEDQTTETEEATVTVTVSESSDVQSYQVDYYVTVNGSSNSDGRTEATAWSIEKGFSSAKAGDVIAIKAGNYGSKNLSVGNAGTQTNPVRFIGYTNIPGDLVSQNESTFKYGESLDAKKMPLIKGASVREGIGLEVHKDFVEIHNLQITDYWIGVIAQGKNLLLKNVITANNGEQETNSIQGGRGYQIYGDHSILENCFSLNANGEGINLKGANNCIIRNTKVFSDNLINMGGYYILISHGGQNNIVEGCTIYRDPAGDNVNGPHQGHGYILKDMAVNNIIRNCDAYNTGVEVNFSGVHDNTFENINIYGNYSKYDAQHSSCIKVINGAHNNTFKNINITDTRYVVAFVDFDDGYIGPGGDRDENQGGNNNEFINIKANGANNIIFFNSVEIGWGATSKNNKFYNCEFENIRNAPFSTKQTTSGTTFTDCTFKNMTYYTLKQVNGHSSDPLPVDFNNCSFQNIGFPTPN